MTPPDPDRPRDRLWTAVGGGVGVALMIAIAHLTQVPMASLPFAATIVLALTTPDVPAAQPWNIISGHVLSSVSGLIALALIGPVDWAAAPAVALSVLLMRLAGALHPPAAINAYLAATQPLGWSYIVAPTLSGAMLVTIYVWLYHRILGNGRWPMDR